MCPAVLSSATLASAHCAACRTCTLCSSMTALEVCSLSVFCLVLCADWCVLVSGSCFRDLHLTSLEISGIGDSANRSVYVSCACVLL